MVASVVLFCYKQKYIKVENRNLLFDLVTFQENKILDFQPSQKPFEANKLGILTHPPNI